MGRRGAAAAVLATMLSPLVACSNRAGDCHDNGDCGGAHPAESSSASGGHAGAGGSGGGASSSTGGGNCSGDPGDANIDEACAVFVRAGATGAAGTRAAPLGDLAQAIELASASGKRVYACGDFGGPLLPTKGFDLWGGFEVPAAAGPGQRRHLEAHRARRPSALGCRRRRKRLAPHPLDHRRTSVGDRRLVHRSRLRQAGRRHDRSLRSDRPARRVGRHHVRRTSRRRACSGTDGRELDLQQLFDRRGRDADLRRRERAQGRRRRRRRHRRESARNAGRRRHPQRHRRDAGRRRRGERQHGLRSRRVRPAPGLRAKAATAASPGSPSSTSRASRTASRPASSPSAAAPADGRDRRARASRRRRWRRGAPPAVAAASVAPG